MEPGNATEISSALLYEESWNVISTVLLGSKRRVSSLLASTIHPQLGTLEKFCRLILQFFFIKRGQNEGRVSHAPDSVSLSDLIPANDE